MIASLLKACPTTGFRVLRRFKGSTKKISPAVLEKLDTGYAKLMKSKSNSLLKKHLRPSIFKRLRIKRTKNSTLLDCIQSGLANHDSGCGVYAPEPEAYKVFADLFDPIIQDYHFGFKKADRHPPLSFGNPCEFDDIDPLKHYIGSTRVRCARSIKGFPFNPVMTRKHYDDIEDLLDCTLSGLKNELKGKFHPLLGMPRAMQRKLIDDHYLFKEGDRFLQAANANRFWPTGRGIYLNQDRTFMVWCNEEDHIRIISMQRGGHFGEVYSRLIRGVKAIERKIPFTRDERLGYMTFCPTNLGTTIRASVHIRVPKLAANPKKLEEVAAKYKLQVRGSRGEHSEAESGIYDISNKRRLGITEHEAVKELYCGIIEIIKLEKAEKTVAALQKDPPRPPPKPLTDCLTKEQLKAATQPKKAKKPAKPKAKGKGKGKEVKCHKDSKQKAEKAAAAAAAKDPKAKPPPKRDCRPPHKKAAAAASEKEPKCFKTKRKPKAKGAKKGKGGKCASPTKPEDKKKPGGKK